MKFGSFSQKSLFGPAFTVSSWNIAIVKVWLTTLLQGADPVNDSFI